MKKILLIFLLIFPSIVYASERVPGTKVYIVPPDGFRQAIQFPGYINEQKKASIMVTEMPAPFLEIVKINDIRPR